MNTTKATRETRNALTAYEFALFAGLTQEARNARNLAYLTADRNAIPLEFISDGYKHGQAAIIWAAANSGYENPLGGGIVSLADAFESFNLMLENPAQDELGFIFGMLDAVEEFLKAQREAA